MGDNSSIRYYRLTNKMSCVGNGLTFFLEPLRSHRSLTLQAVAIALGSPPGLDGKILLLIHILES